jgi:hypothetical protein
MRCYRKFGTFISPDGEQGYNAETRWEELAEAGYLTRSIRFFSQSRALHLPCRRRRVLATVHLCLA